VPETVLDAASVVKAPVLAVVLPIAAGAARYVDRYDAKPEPDTVLDALRVVNAPVLAVVLPIGPGIVSMPLGSVVIGAGTAAPPLVLPSTVLFGMTGVTWALATPMQIPRMMMARMMRIRSRLGS
jgi:hypothetical protein